MAVVDAGSKVRSDDSRSRDVGHRVRSLVEDVEVAVVRVDEGATLTRERLQREGRPFAGEVVFVKGAV